MKKLTILALVLFWLSSCSSSKSTDVEPLDNDQEVYHTGLVVPQSWREKARFSSILGSNVPAAWDWRTKVKTVPPIKNQGNCGSCWAFSTSTVMEWQLAIANKSAILSPQELVSCDDSSYGCGGGFFTAFDYEKNPGLALEADYPYTASNSSCRSGDVSHANKITSWAYVGQSHRLPSSEEIRAAIYSQGPVSVTVCASGGFMKYSGGGIYNGGGNCQNHMVTLVGFGGTDTDEPYFILQNSWGKDWGENGYMRIAPGASAVGQITAFAVYK